MKEDYSYLDDFAGFVYEYIFNRLVHKMDQKSAKDRIMNILSTLDQKEKDYVKSWVISAFNELRQKKVNK